MDHAGDGKEVKGDPSPTMKLLWNAWSVAMLLAIAALFWFGPAGGRQLTWLVAALCLLVCLLGVLILLGMRSGRSNVGYKPGIITPETDPRAWGLQVLTAWALIILFGVIFVLALQASV
jgi:hypothetical protein